MATIANQQSQDQRNTCRFWLQGRCRYGSSCRDAHINRGQGNLNEASVNVRSPIHNKHPNTSNNGRQGRGQRSNKVRGDLGKGKQPARKSALQDNIRDEAKGNSSVTVGPTNSDEEETPKAHSPRHADDPLLQSSSQGEDMKHRAERTQERLEKEKRENERIQAILLEERQREAGTIQQFFVSESSLITCGAGLEIQHVIPGFELCQITIRNLPEDAKPSEIEDIFLQQGIPKSQFYVISLKNGMQNKSTKESMILIGAEHGEVITAGLEGNEFRDSLLSLEVSQNTNLHANIMGSRSSKSTSLTVGWYEPSTAIRATYASSAVAIARQRFMDQKIFRGRRIKAILEGRREGTRHRIGHSQCSVKLLNFPANTPLDDDLTEFTGTSALNVLFSGGAAFWDPRGILVEHIRFRNGIRMDTLRDIPLDAVRGEKKIEVQFDTWENAKTVHDSLDKKKISNIIFRPWLPQPLQYEIRIPKEQYEAQKTSWDELSEKKDGNDAVVRVRAPPHNAHVFIRAEGENKKDVGALKVRVESLASGRKLDSQTHWHSSFASIQARKLFDRVKRETGVLVRNDFKTQCLKVYGDATKLDEAADILKQEADNLRDEEVSIHIEPWMVRFFLNKGLEELKELLGEDQVRLNIASHKVVVKGGDEATQQVRRLVQEARLKGRAASASTGTGGDGDAACAVCTDTASHPELLICGHTYCKACLKHFIVSAVDGASFPVTCVGDGNTCNRPISIPIIRRFLTKQAFDALVETVFRVYMEKNNQEFKYCTTADCKQIYRHGGEQDVQCPSCLATFCPKCDEPHEDMSCEQWKAHKDPDGEHEGLGSLGYKKCPNCKVWVDRTEGCNHMTCVKCTTHFCWLCLVSYPTGPEVYAHMTAMHGGFYGDGPPQGGGGVAQAVAAPRVADPFGAVNYAQQREELLRIERERAFRERVGVQQELDQARRLREEAERRRGINQQPAAYNYFDQIMIRQRLAQEERLQQERNRLRELQRVAEQRRVDEERIRILRLQREAEQRQREEGGGWCIVM
ncbi:hypothetical protein CVT24_005016 [Panaeolus cyanescens]|uniref:RBR-type E3 ubiquitin transferase n=1 Tax=Panaeolus cyanescens TaxID=181874 RepID=A0A409YB70_9AGAR|nr:hypothetical protein CVT24_005016 [Panaeolus cyanescens]